jgi:hypothetical protein
MDARKLTVKACGRTFVNPDSETRIDSNSRLSVMEVLASS